MLSENRTFRKLALNPRADSSEKSVAASPACHRDAARSFAVNSASPSSAPVTEPLQFDRRLCERWKLDGCATAFCLGGDSFGRMHALSNIDYSYGGLGADSMDAIEPGSVVSIGFQNPGCIARRGVVVRSLRRDRGWRVAIRFETRLAA